jgi:hypothetical protein
VSDVEQIAATLLYEGYILWPYRRSARKNLRRWTIGGVYPREYSEASRGSDPWLMQTQCLVTGRRPLLTVRVRFLHVVQRQVYRRDAGGGLAPVDELDLGGERYTTWDEATEREFRAGPLPLTALDAPLRVPIAIPAGEEETPLTDAEGGAAGAVRRSWRGVEGGFEAGAEPFGDGVFRITVRITNTTPWSGGGHEEAIKQAFVSTHTILTVAEGEFVSLLEPPPELEPAAAACQNIKTWPVLAGAPGERSTMLSSPIIVYDYPQVAPESPVTMFDGGEIDELLLLNVLALTDAEKEEMRAADPHSRAILERAESLNAEDFGRLHGAIRDFRVIDADAPVGSPLAALDGAAPASVRIDGVDVRKGSRVRLHPRGSSDIFDIVLQDKVAIVEEVEQDYDDRLKLAVTIEDDPGRDLGQARMIGHRFYFGPDEVEPIATDGGRT